MRRRLIAHSRPWPCSSPLQAALAQSAGDEQYADPFGDVKQPTQDQGGSNGSPAPDRGSDRAGARDRPCQLAADADPGTGGSLPLTGFPARAHAPCSARCCSARASRCAAAPSRPPRCRRGSSPPHRAGVGSARDGDAAVSASVAINARAAVRARTGGVERVASELVSRLPALRPDRYRVVAPRPALAHRAGHAWEQAVLPLAARGAAADPLARQHRAAREPAQRRLRPRPGSAARAGLVRTRLRRLAPVRDCAGSRRGRGCCWCRPSSCARELHELLGVEPDRVRVVPPGGASRPLARRRASPHRARRAIRAGPRNPERAQEPRAARPGGTRASRGWPGASSSQEQAAPTCRSRLRAPGGSATSKSGTSRRSTRTRRSWRCPRSTRASGYRASRRWHAGHRSWRPTAPRYPRRAAARRCWWTRTTRTPSRPR